MRHGIASDRYTMVPGTLDAPDFGLDASAAKALAASVRQVIHCAAMVNLAIGRTEMLDWSARGMDTVLQFCCDANADLRFTSSSSVFPDRGGPWPETPAKLWDNITGYGAAKIAAETAIRASGISAAIVRCRRFMIWTRRTRVTSMKSSSRHLCEPVTCRNR